MCDQPISEARSPRCEDEEARKKDREEMNKGQNCSWHLHVQCLAPDSTVFTGQGHHPIFQHATHFHIWGITLSSELRFG